MVSGESEPMRLENILDGIHASITHRWYLQLFTVFTRIILAVGFIPPSYKKIIHQPFTSLPDSNPVGHYFNALYQTGFYYEFIGWAQMIAAILLLFPRTAHWGALMFLPIIVNIAVLTTSVGFAGTWLLTIFMSLAALWLVTWEYDRLKPILFSTRKQPTRKLPLQVVLLPAVFAVGGAAMAGLWACIRLGNFSNYYYIAALLSGLGLVFGLVVALHLKFMKVGELQDGGSIL
jgi:hypothetical protein